MVRVCASCYETIANEFMAKQAEDELERQRLVNAKEISKEEADLESWFYEDEKGQIQGPFPISRMEAWYRAGYFPRDQRIRRDSRGNLTELIKADPTLVNAFRSIESVWKNEDETFAVWPVPWPEDEGDDDDVWEEAYDEETKEKYYYNRKQRSSVWDLPEGAQTKLGALDGSSRTGSTRSRKDDDGKDEAGNGPASVSTSSIIKKLSLTSNLSNRSGTSNTADPESLDEAEQKHWFFLDEANDRQGPFTSYEMRQWVDAGYFDETLRVLEQGREEDKEFATLQELFGGLDQCFPSGIVDDDDAASTVGGAGGGSSRRSSSARSSDVGEESNLGGVVAEEELDGDEALEKPELLASLSSDSIRVAGVTRRRSQTVGHLVKGAPLIGRSMLQEFSSSVVREDDGVVAEEDENEGSKERGGSHQSEEKQQQSFHRRQPSPSSPERYLGKHVLASRAQHKSDEKEGQVGKAAGGDGGEGGSGPHKRMRRPMRAASDLAGGMSRLLKAKAGRENNVFEQIGVKDISPLIGPPGSGGDDDVSSERSRSGEMLGALGLAADARRQHRRAMSTVTKPTSASIKDVSAAVSMPSGFTLEQWAAIAATFTKENQKQVDDELREKLRRKVLPAASSRFGRGLQRSLSSSRGALDVGSGGSSGAAGAAITRDLGARSPSALTDETSGGGGGVRDRFASNLSTAMLSRRSMDWEASTSRRSHDMPQETAEILWKAINTKATSSVCGMLFKGLDISGKRRVLDHMHKRMVEEGDVVIAQGDRGYFCKGMSIAATHDETPPTPPPPPPPPPQYPPCRNPTTNLPYIPTAEGNAFFIVEQGDFDIFVRADKTSESSEQHKKQHNYNTPSGDDDGEEGGSSGFGRLCVTLGLGSAFGELSLLYDSPRAATVVSKGIGTLWYIERDAFRRVVRRGAKRRHADYQRYLARISVLSDNLPQSDINKLADALEIEHYFDGAVIAHQGEPSNSAYIIWEGEVHLEKADGKVEVLKRGQYFGEYALIKEESWAVNAIANVSDDSAEQITVLRLERDDVSELVEPLEDIIVRRWEMERSEGNVDKHEIHAIVHDAHVPAAEEEVKELGQRARKLSQANAVGTILAGINSLGLRQSFEELEARVSQSSDQLEQSLMSAPETKVSIVHSEGDAGEDTGALSRASRRGSTGVSLKKRESSQRSGRSRRGSLTREASSGSSSSSSRRLQREESSEDYGEATDNSYGSDDDDDYDDDDDDYEEQTLPWTPSDHMLGEDITFDDLKPLAVLGTGSFGKVKLVQHTKTDRVFALKCMKRFYIVDNGWEGMVENERAAMVELSAQASVRLCR